MISTWFHPRGSDEFGDECFGLTFNGGQLIRVPDEQDFAILGFLFAMLEEIGEKGSWGLKISPRPLAGNHRDLIDDVKALGSGCDIFPVADHLVLLLFDGVDVPVDGVRFQLDASGNVVCSLVGIGETLGVISTLLGPVYHVLDHGGLAGAARRSEAVMGVSGLESTFWNEVSAACWLSLGVITLGTVSIFVDRV